MHLYRSSSSLRRRGRARCRVAAIGAFDGLHLGHREILDLTLREAESRGCCSIVCSFEPMPSEYFAPSDPPARLTCFRERFELLDAMGIAEMFCPPFGAIRSLSPEAFIEDVLAAAMRVQHVVVGHDFQFGAGRAGTLAHLERHGPRCGFDVTVVAPVYRAGERISSTAIRAALKAGDLERARRMLGRDYAMSGRIVHGRGVGKDLGFPTANVNLKRRLAPVDGIFAVRVDGLAAHALDGVASVGNRPMLGGGKTLLEVHLFDFDRAIYGEYITVRFVRRLREERTFSDLAAMQRQMRRDASEARAALSA